MILSNVRSSKWYLGFYSKSVDLGCELLGARTPRRFSRGKTYLVMSWGSPASRLFVLVSFCVLFQILLATLAVATTYYIDFEQGSDVDDGTSPSSPWKTIPGTYDAGLSNWQSTCWGSGCPANPTISSSRKVPKGTTFKLKSGATHNRTNGSYILIDSTFYSKDGDMNSPIVFERDTGWGSGNTVFDAANMGFTASNADAFVVIRVSGVKFDGKTGRGIHIINSGVTGIKAKDSGGTPIRDIEMRYVYGFNNGTSYASDATGSGAAHIHFKAVNRGTITNCEVDGNRRYINGFLFGESHLAAADITVSNCTAHQLQGDFITNDSGVGFKGYNSRITFNDCDSYSNLKGFDLGEQNGENADIVYELNRVSAYENAWGINFNGPHAPYVGQIRFYVINSIVRDNQRAGSNIYSGPYKLYMVHNVYHNNGLDASVYNRGNLLIGPDTSNRDDSNHIDVYLYNNSFYKPSSQSNYQIKFWKPTVTDFSLYSDYNSWIQNSSEYFAIWGANAGSEETTVFYYGENGPGRASTNWYNWYGGSATPPSAGGGHFHQDSNSYATGGAKPTPPPFTSVSSRDYTLTAPYPGTDLSSKPWYVPEMGRDRGGIERVSWDVGPFEFRRMLDGPSRIRVVPPQQ